MFFNRDGNEARRGRFRAAQSGAGLEQGGANLKICGVGTEAGELK